MWELDHKEGWALKNWCFWTVVLEKTIESPLDCKEIKRVNHKGNQSWIFIERTDAEVEAPIRWPCNAKSQLSRKFMFIESMMPSSHLILCCPIHLLPPIAPSIRVFFNESTLRMKWPKYWSFSFSISPSNEYLDTTEQLKNNNTW